MPSPVSPTCSKSAARQRPVAPAGYLLSGAPLAICRIVTEKNARIASHGCKCGLTRLLPIARCVIREFAGTTPAEELRRMLAYDMQLNAQGLLVWRERQ